MIIVFSLFLFYLLIKVPKGSVTMLLILLYFLSLCCNYFLGTVISFSLSSILYGIWTAIVLSCLLLPWKNYNRIKTISCVDVSKVDKFTFVVGALCMFMTIGCAIIAYSLKQTVSDISYFKYGGGYEYEMYVLGIDLKPYMLAYMLYPLGYLFIPLIFFYLNRRRYFMAIWSFLCSLAPVAYGLSYFSRAHTTHYVMMVGVFMWLYRDCLPEKAKKKVLVIGIIVVALISSSFMSISFNRFEGHEYADQYSNSVIKNETYYGMADYYGQWWSRGEIVFSRYNFEGFNGMIAFRGVVGFFSTLSFGLVPSYANYLTEKRISILREYYGSFIGVSSYFLYDTGIVVSLLIVLLYGRLVRRNAPLNGTVSISAAMEQSILIILPLFGIFYTTIDVVFLLYMLFLLFKKFFSFG